MDRLPFTGSYTPKSLSFRYLNVLDIVRWAWDRNPVANNGYKDGSNQMSFEMPIIILLMAANILWFIVGWGKGFSEGKREGLIMAKSYQRVTTDAR